MTETDISVLRWILLGVATFALLQATVLFEFFEKQFFDRMFALNERAGAQIPTFMRSRTLHRASAIFTAVAFAALWWFAGTPAGVAFFRNP